MLSSLSSIEMPGCRIEPSSSSSDDTDYVRLLAELTALLEHPDQTLAALALAREHRTIFREDPWDIVPAVARKLTRQNSDHHPALYAACQEIMTIIVETVQADDVLLQLMTVIDSAADDAHFVELVMLLPIVLAKVNKRRFKYLSWALSSVHTYLAQLPEPENYDFSLDDEEKLLLDSNEEVDRISWLYHQLIPFYMVTIDEYLASAYPEPRRILAKYLVKLLGTPFCLLDMSVIESKTRTTKSRARVVAERLVQLFTRVCSDPFRLLSDNIDMGAVDEGTGEDEMHKSNLALGTLFYLILSEHVCITDTPRVYSHFFVFQRTIGLLVDLLDHNQHQFVVEKGLRLAEAVTDNLEEVALSSQLLRCMVHSKFCRVLYMIITYNKSAACRKRALHVFNKYLYQFDTCGRYNIVVNIMEVPFIVGYFKSYIITRFKQMAAEAFEAGEVTPYFAGDKLLRVLRICFHLPATSLSCSAGRSTRSNSVSTSTITTCSNSSASTSRDEATDFVDKTDELLAAYNLLRFLLIRDKTNVSGIWDHVRVLEESHFGPLRQSLTLCKSQYRQKIQQMQSGGGEKWAEEVDITVGGKIVCDMSNTDKVNILHSTMKVFDIVDSLMQRVDELMAER